MDSHAHKFQLPETATCTWYPSGSCSRCGLSMGRAENGIRPCSEPPPHVIAAFTPALQQARVEHNGSTYVLTLVRSLFKDEGSALLEREPGGSGYFVQNGEWRITSRDDAPSTLSLDFDDSGDIDGFYELLDKLASALTSRPDSWAESFQPLGGF